MIVNEHVEQYINSMEPDLPEYLEILEKHAIETGVPIIRRSMQTFLKFLLEKEKPRRILEIGAAIGFSGLFMKEFAPEDCELTTIEKVEMRLKEARVNLAGKSGIRLLEGDAAVVLKNLAEQTDEAHSYDLVFLDAAKAQYMSYLPHILELLKHGGMLITDNVLLEGSIAESKFSIERRDRTIHMRMREYLYEITHREDLRTVILPVGDGVAVSYYRI